MSSYYSNWEREEYVCDLCGWEGLGEECKSGEIFESLMERDCPNCHERLFVVTFPTIEESRENWDEVSEADKKLVEANERFVEAAKRRWLESPDQLPDAHGDELVFVWDEDLKYDTVVRYGNQVIWKEPACYEGYERFAAVLKILSQKYGRRLIDVVYTQRSERELFGDKLLYPERVMDKARRKLQNP